MSSQFDQRTVASNAVDGSLSPYHETCALTKIESTSPWLLVDLLSEYHILYVRIKKEMFMNMQPAPSHLMLELVTTIKPVE